ncbi:MAG: glycerol-3-phosphate acyltransferase [Candidatus Dormibacteria bacterium]
MSVTPTPLSGAIAFVIAYAVGALPVAWLLVRREKGIDLRLLGGTGAIDTLRAAGPSTALLAALIEMLKGGVVGLTAFLLSHHSDWFAASAIAGCVVGDAFPVGFRRGGRGLVPLISGLALSLPLAGLLCAVIAVPVAITTRMRGSVYDLAVTVAVPLGLLLGSFDWRTLAPAAVIVLALVIRSRMRRVARARAGLTHRAGATILDLPSPPRQEP